MWKKKKRNNSIRFQMQTFFKNPPSLHPPPFFKKAFQNNWKTFFCCSKTIQKKKIKKITNRKSTKKFLIEFRLFFPYFFLNSYYFNPLLQIQPVAEGKKEKTTFAIKKMNILNFNSNQSSNRIRKKKKTTDFFSFICSKTLCSEEKFLITFQLIY